MSAARALWALSALTSAVGVLGHFDPLLIVAAMLLGAAVLVAGATRLARAVTGDEHRTDLSPPRRKRPRTSVGSAGRRLSPTRGSRAAPGERPGRIASPGPRALAAAVLSFAALRDLQGEGYVAPSASAAIPGA